MTEVQTVEGKVAELEAKIESFAAELAEFRKVHVSRRGVEGARGETGPAGIGVAGPQGLPGKDADISQAVEAAKQAIEAEYGFCLSPGSIKELIKHQLILSGVLDLDGNAILIPGPEGKAGIPGADSQVAGPSGKDGESIVGPAGRDAKIVIGSVTAGDTASVSLRESEDGTILDFVLPRGEKGATGATGASIVGPKGDKGDSVVGPEGERGLPGESGLSKAEVVALVQDMKRRGSI
jgi:hypothetical protein